MTAGVTYVLTGPVRKFAIAAGAMTAIRERDVHKEPTPRLGGIAMFGGLCAGLLVAEHLTKIGQIFSDTSDVRALLSGAAVVWVIGVMDDKWDLDALVKLGGQMVAAGVMVLQGFKILWLPIPGVGTVLLTSFQGTLLTVVLVVATVNAVNFVDGLNGLAAGMVCIAALAFFVYAYRLWYGYNLEAAAPAALFSAVLVGMCLGYLPHNMTPARIFMGDSGALLLGLVLSAPSISLAGQVDPDNIAAQAGSGASATLKLLPFYIPLVLPLAMVAIPLADMVMAVVRRTLAGRSPFSADKKHLHHRLLELGHSETRAVLVMYFWSAVLCFGTVALSVRSGKREVLLVLVAAVAVGVGILLLPRWSPRVPRWMERFVPPRYRASRHHGRHARDGAVADYRRPSGATAVTSLSDGETSSELPQPESEPHPHG
ncbi:undecaprenyl-phosphate alpha-N-acetylglucosaminyl 1-phosphate transferase [Mangrovactinospora gilvigrisea]|uniref:Undecaprenyl-phosphate alpha-N-acetylglucosaminyl 1-phosphate transferase n=1 Tax=Mangrovactinospora gilvigrisea TaxID=1428644 RepID=A0A1J7BDR6_9ACTN|nr:undecaprenyl-phosphate alpha-N-acetylglucosaminyl 1-phosphate transferase [Mangrovactinospora gilvigrisea]